MSLHFIPLGTGHPTSSEHPPTTLAIGSDGRWLMVNCPGEILRMLRSVSASAKVGLALERFDGVVLTSPHAYRMAGLEVVARQRRDAGAAPLKLIAHPDVLRDLWEHGLAGGMAGAFEQRGGPVQERGIHDYFDVTTLTPGRPTTVGAFTIDCHRGVHPVPTTAVRVQVGSESVAYSSDTDVDKAVIQWLHHADTIVQEIDHGPGHTPIAALLKLPMHVRGKLRLSGVPDDQLEQPTGLEVLEAGRWYRS